MVFFFFKMTKRLLNLCCIEGIQLIEKKKHIKTLNKLVLGFLLILACNNEFD